MSRAIVAVFAVIILASAGLLGINAAYEDAGDDHRVVNETWTPDAGNWTTLDESNRNGAFYDNDTTVYNASDAEMDRGTDYEWNDSAGTVRALVGGDLDGDSSAKITYAFQQTTADQRRLVALAGELPRLVGTVAPVFAVVILLLFIKGLAG